MTNDTHDLKNRLTKSSTENYLTGLAIGFLIGGFTGASISYTVTLEADSRNKAQLYRQQEEINLLESLCLSTKQEK